jgi:hypothetical protein
MESVTVILKDTKPKMFENTRKLTYSYLCIKELLKVASLTKRERETVLNSKIIKENRNECWFKCNFFTSKIDSYLTKNCQKGLLTAIQLSNRIQFYFDDYHCDYNNFK